MAESQKERIMRLLNVSAEEAEAIMQSDRAIDRGERMDFDLPPEQEKLAKKMANVQEHRRPTVYKFDKRQRKENATKKGIIDFLHKILTENEEFAFENITITNKERQISFTIGENTFELTLVQKRQPKK